VVLRPAPEEETRIPAVSLPKGGGALRAIDEKFAVNSANGTCELTVPLPFSKTRNGLDGAIALHYSSGSGNSIFGLGWNHTLSSIQRRTDHQLPRYEDEDESDVFIIAGAEDLVPAYRKPGTTWERDTVTTADGKSERYRPRIEGAWSRVERITPAGGAAYWKITTRENVVTIYGRSAAARIADPADASHVFRWLPEWTYDDKGNCAEYVYKPEDLVNVPDSVEEQHRRDGLAPFVNKHLKRIRYGNVVPYYPDAAHPFIPAAPDAAQYLFEAVFDYGEHDADVAEAHTWACRIDPFSDYRAGFEIRTWRLCRRVLFFHAFTQLGATPTLVRSIDLEYRHNAEADFITSIRRTHYKRSGGGYVQRSLPPIELSYNELQWDTAVHDVSPDDVADTSRYQWIDLYGDGVPGLLSEEAAAWYYKRNLGGGTFRRAAAVVPKPSLAGLGAGSVQLQDLDADGTKHAVATLPGLAGSFELDDDDQWQPFRAFEQMPSVALSDPNAKLLDLDGDGRPDLLVIQEQAFVWFPSLGMRGFGEPRLALNPRDEEGGPAIVFNDGTQTIFTADMTGDGLSDIARVRNGEICYWPNLGYGRFGAKVTMRNAPLLDHPDRFDASYVQLADISGTGAADLVYLGRDGFTAWINLAGNAWSDAQPIDPFPHTSRPRKVAVLDILGNGTSAIVWSSELVSESRAAMRYVDLMGNRKPYLLNGYRNDLGKEVRISYRSSASYALDDARDGRPWVTRLPFPMLCVSRTETIDAISGSHLVHEARYRHGHYDHAEREFRGFGMVEETDSESFDHVRGSALHQVIDDTLHQPPRRTRTWYHTGAFFRAEPILAGFARDYWQNAATAEHPLPDPPIESDDPLLPEERRQAARACKTMMLRQEVFADDGSPDAASPYTTATHNCHIRMLQPMLQNRYAVFAVVESEALTYNYERVAADPRIVHELNTVIGPHGEVEEKATVVYARAVPDLTLQPHVVTEQSRIRIRYEINGYTNDVAIDRAYRLRQIAEKQTYELHASPAAPYFAIAEIRAKFLGAAPADKVLVEGSRTLFGSDADPNIALAAGVLEPLGLRFENRKLAFTAPLLGTLFGTRVSDPMLLEGGYVQDGSDWWIRSGAMRYPATPGQHFYLPDRYIDGFGVTTTVHYDAAYQLVVERTTDALGNDVVAQSFDFRFVQPSSIKDINDNINDAAYDIFGFVAGTALRGKGSEADDLTGFDPDPSPAQIAAFLADPAANGAVLLAHATTRFIYRLDTAPAAAAMILRETHHHDEITPSKLQYSFEYSDGGGRVVMKKMQAEPGFARSVDIHGDGSYTISDVDTTPNLRWIGSGRTIVNNKGNRVLQYEPYFSATHDYETARELVESGVTLKLRYDPLDRLIRTDFPDGSSSRAEIGAWIRTSFDQNDTVIGSDWYTARIGGGLGADEKSAAQKAAAHDGTPAVEHFDTLGRAVALVAHNRTGGIDQLDVTRIDLDLPGNRLRVRDPRGNDVVRTEYDLASRACHSISMDAGERHMLTDALGDALYRWDQKGNRLATAYDALHRPVSQTVVTPALATIVIERRDYGTDRVRNVNGRVEVIRDQSGVVTNSRYDFKGNVVETARRFTRDYAPDIDWTTPGTVPLQPATFTTTETFDALNRVTSMTTPDGSISTPGYSESGKLTSVSAAIRGGAPQTFVSRITHDAKAQRTQIDYGNGVTMKFDYDTLTFRVRHITTTRTSDGAKLQDLAYTYDPVGNVTLVRDAAQKTIYFNGAVVDADNDFTYDALYRLLSATGRELIGLDAPVSRLDAERTNIAHKADGSAMRNYRQQYAYDRAGNVTEMSHDSGSGPFTHQWTRTFNVDAGDNRLGSSQVGATNEPYTYDLHGNMTSLPGLATVDWDVTDRLHHADLGGGGNAYYTYDSQGNRVRKVVERLGGIVEERLYIGQLEIFTSRLGAAVQLRRETLHVMDDTRRLAMIDTRTDPSVTQLIRYQFGNHLGTALLELDDAAGIVGYEEYYPYGSTSLQSVDKARDVPARRYRYTGRERDEETGLYYNTLRYYAPWLARWTSPDPAGSKDGDNLYRYTRDNPIRFFDPTGTQSRTDDQPWPTYHVEPQPPIERIHTPDFRWVLDPPPIPRWVNPLARPDPPAPPEPPKPVSMYNFNVTQGAGEEGNRGTAEFVPGVTLGSPPTFGYTALARYAWSHFAAGVTTNSAFSGPPFNASTATGGVIHAWWGIGPFPEGTAPEDRTNLNRPHRIGFYQQVTGGDLLTRGRSFNPVTSTTTGALSFSWGSIGLDINAVGTATNVLQTADPNNTVFSRGAVGGGASAAITIAPESAHGYHGFMLEGIISGTHAFGGGTAPSADVLRYGLGVGFFQNFPLPGGSMLFIGPYLGVGEERGNIFTPPAAGGGSMPTRTPYRNPNVFFNLPIGVRF